MASSNSQAELLFIQGIEMEKLGKVFEAMRLYRRAVHIDPDIEFKIYESSLNTQNNNITVQSTIGMLIYGRNLQ